MTKLKLLFGKKDITAVVLIHLSPMNSLESSCFEPTQTGDLTKNHLSVTKTPKMN